MKCQHLNRRCIHGDEIVQASTIRKVRRQRCLDCGRPLHLPAICTLTGKNIHEAHDEPDAETLIERDDNWFFRLFRT
jgi:hypothetical protein